MRKMFKHMTLAALASAAFSMTGAQAADWPAAGKTIQIVVPAPGGGGTGDTIARVVAEELAKTLNTTVIVDNKAEPTATSARQTRPRPHRTAIACCSPGPARWRSTPTCTRS